MQKPAFDPGLTQKYTGNFRRVINKDGTFNVRRRGATWRDFHPYLHLINMDWLPFFAAVVSGLPGREHAVRAGLLRARSRHLCRAPTAARTTDDSSTTSSSPPTPSAPWATAASGPGPWAPTSWPRSNPWSASWASRSPPDSSSGACPAPPPKSASASSMLITAYQDIQSLQFRVVNRRRNDLMETRSPRAADDRGRQGRPAHAQIPPAQTRARAGPVHAAHLDHRAPHRFREPACSG